MATIFLLIRMNSATTVTLLQSAQKGRHMNVLENYVIHFEHYNMIVNE